MKRVATIMVLAVAGLALAGGGLWSYLKTAGEQMIGAVKEEVPIEFELQRARGIVDALVPEIRKNLQIIAKEEVEVERLADKIANADRKLTQQKADILRMTGDLEQGKVVYVYGGTQYTGQQVKHDVASKFERFKRHEADYQSLCAIKAAREQSLAAARQKLENMLDVKRQLEVDVEHLESRFRLLEVAQTTSNVQFDDSKLGQAKELIGEIRTRLVVAERVLNAEAAYLGEIKLDDRQTDNIVDEVAKYFAGESTSLAARE